MKTATPKNRSSKLSKNIKSAHPALNFVAAMASANPPSTSDGINSAASKSTTLKVGLLPKRVLLNVVILLTCAVFSLGHGSNLPSSEIPLLDDETSVRIPVILMGQEVYFTVDTGAELTILDKKYEDRLGPPIRTTAASTMVSHSVAFTLFQAPEIKIGNDSIKLSSVGSLDLSGIRMIAGAQLDGILGMDAMGNRMVCFDPDNGTFAFFRSISQKLKQQALAIPLTKVDARAYSIQVRLNGTGPINLRLDSGDNLFISLNRSDWDSVFGTRKLTGGFQIIGADGQTTKTHMTRLDEVLVSTNRYTNVIVRMIPNPAIPSTIGFGFIRQHRAVFDFPNEMMYLTPNRKFGEMVEYNMSGLRLIKSAEKIIVHSVEEKSPAFDAGIRAGDEILSINGKVAASLSLKSIRQSLKTKSGDKVTVQFGRNGKATEVNLILKTLI